MGTEIVLKVGVIAWHLGSDLGVWDWVDGVMRLWLCLAPFGGIWSQWQGVFFHGQSGVQPLLGPLFWFLAMGDAGALPWRALFMSFSFFPFIDDNGL